MTRHGVASYYIIAFTFLVLAFGFLGLALVAMSLQTEERALVISTDDCLKADKRAVMLCPKHGRCWIECREKVNDRPD